MMKKNRGFTLIELLAAMVILGLLMAIALPTVLGLFCFIFTLSGIF